VARQKLIEIYLVNNTVDGSGSDLKKVRLHLTGEEKLYRKGIPNSILNLEEVRYKLITIHFMYMQMAPL
jgi:hypothetical protein